MISNRYVYRLLWLVPLILFALTVHQSWVVCDVHRTMTSGRPVTARVDHFGLKSMAAQTHALLTLVYPAEEGDSLRRELTLPATIASEVRQEPTLEVRVGAGADGRVVILRIQRVQRRMAMINALMAMVGTVLSAGAISAWGRSLE